MKDLFFMLELKVSRSIGYIRQASELYSLPFVLGFSGGKDSTVTLSLLLKAKEQGAKIRRLYVAYADTLLEHPVLHREALEALESLRGIEGVEPVVLKPAEGEDYVSMILDKGYPAPSWYFRWCVDRLKIRPVKRFMNKIGRAVRVLGVRADESSVRMRTTEIKGKRPAIVSGKSPTLRPIIDWTESDVVEYLKAERRWDGKSFDYLISLYGYEIEDACAPNVFCPARIRANEATAYTSVRFGCWVCTVVKRNKMPVDQVLEAVRERIKAVSDNPKNRIFVDGKPRKLNAEARKEIAKLLLHALDRKPDAFGYDPVALRLKLEGFLARAEQGSAPAQRY